MAERFLAHVLPATENSERKEQSIIDHLEKTAELASNFAVCFGAENFAYRCGLLHDIGKYSESFQKRIRGENIRTDHSTAGAYEAYRLKDLPAALAIAGHHAGIPDFGNKRFDTAESGTFAGRIKKCLSSGVDDYSSYMGEVKNVFEQPGKIGNGEDIFFFTHMLFSCLVDADWLDTENFMTCGRTERGTGEPMVCLQEKLLKYITPWFDSTKPINVRRCKILRELMEAGDKPKGLYTLTVPTGGGKTVSSVAFALKNALKNGLRRIIYVIPYMSIIEQTQTVFEDIFGRENVVAHYSNVRYDTDENGEIDEKDKRRYLASENWDAPIIVTTAVQFFESLFGNKPSVCRKLHNIAESVIVFDEAQMLPIHLLEPCVWAITELVKKFSCTAVLCTATQPSLGGLIKKYYHDEVAELCSDTDDNYEFFRRVNYVFDGEISEEELSERLSTEYQTLCIVNNRKQAQRLFRTLPEEGRYHLSTAMTASDRRKILSEIRKRLKEGEICRVVSTSLIEAGVDVDFPSVYKSLSGLDSVIQAGGRCNREGKRDKEKSVVHIFRTDERIPLGLRQNVDAAERVLRDNTEIDSPSAVKKYFDFLLKLKGDEALDEKNIMGLVNELKFSEVAEEFKVIGRKGFTIYIPNGEGKELIERLEKFGPSRSLMRKLGEYAVSVYDGQFSELERLGAVRKISDDIAVLTTLNYYDEQTGLNLSPEGGEAFMF